jgi:hypothetical protein
VDKDKVEKVLRSDYEALLKNKVFNEFMSYLDLRERFYIDQLTSGKDIAVTMSYGQLWQKMIEEVRKIRSKPERLISDETD